MPGKQAENVQVRFLRHVEEDASGCWLWTGSISNGYGKFSTRDGACVRAHIFAYLMWKGDYDRSLDLDHTCRVRRCVNPAHLEPVTRTTNLLRSPLINADMRACPDCGGPYSRFANGKAFCRPCTNEKQMARYYDKKERTA